MFVKEQGRPFEFSLGVSILSSAGLHPTKQKANEDFV